MPKYLVQATPLKCVQGGAVVVIPPGETVELSEEEAKKIGDNVKPKGMLKS